MGVGTIRGEVFGVWRDAGSEGRLKRLVAGRRLVRDSVGGELLSDTAFIGARKALYES